MSASAKVWPLSQMLRMLEKGTMSYSNIYQRCYVWDRETECNLMATLIEGRDIPAITANHIVNQEENTNYYDLLNGKQRITASQLFRDNQYPISNLRKLKVNPEDAIDFTDEEKELLHYEVDEKGSVLIDVNGFYFKDLPPILQNTMMSRMIRIEYRDNMSREDERQTIINANSGKGMTTAEKLRVEMASFEQIINLAKHPVFTVALTEKAIAGYWNEKIVEQIYCMLYMDEPALDTKSLRPFIREAVMTPEQEKEISAILDRFLDIYEDVMTRNMRYAKARILGKIHMVSMAPFIKRSIDEDVPLERMARFMEYFFSGKKRATLSNEYNEWASTNTAQKKSIEKRFTAVNAYYEEYIVGEKEIPEVIYSEPKKAGKEKEKVIRTVVTSDLTEKSAESANDDTGNDLNVTENHAETDVTTDPDESADDTENVFSEVEEETAGDGGEPLLDLEEEREPFVSPA